MDLGLGVSWLPILPCPRRLVTVLDPDIVVREDTGSGTVVEVRRFRERRPQSNGLLAAQRAAGAYQGRGRLGLTARRTSPRNRRLTLQNGRITR